LGKYVNAQGRVGAVTQSVFFFVCCNTEISQLALPLPLSPISLFLCNSLFWPNEFLFLF